MIGEAGSGKSSSCYSICDDIEGVFKSYPGKDSFTK